MKTTINNIKHLCALLLTALTFAACSGDTDEIINLPEPEQPTSDGIRFTAQFDVKNATTRALSDPNNGTLTASWQVGEEIAIVFGGAKYIAKVIAVNDGIATVYATLPDGTPNNQAVTFIYPASAADGSGLRSGLLANQDGTLATLSSQFDVATAEGNIVVNGTDAMPNGTVTLDNQYAICKLQFKDESNAAITDISEVTITDLATQEVITVTTPSPQSAVYVAMTPTNNSVWFKVNNCGGKTYTKVATSNLQAGLFYHPTLTTSCIFDAESTPLTFEAIEDCTIKFNNHAEGSLYYTIEGGESGEFHVWNVDGAENESITLTAGQKVSFYGDNETYGYYGNYDIISGSKFSVRDGFCCVYGNIMSLISSTGYTNLKVLTGEVNFSYLFGGCDALKSHPDKQLLLPATTLTKNCYRGMFLGCENLTKAPALPATTLANADGCYGEMFWNCRSLSNAPALPATTLAQNCYQYMFTGCESLTTAPALPATTLAPFCYHNMFFDCSSLTKAPDLPATTLELCCYAFMFTHCIKLNSIKCLATSIDNSQESPTHVNWLDGVAANGTFIKAASMEDWTEGGSGIPSGWTVVDE